ncbi:hypothetical protein [Candidatus Hodgkinia cicadicola]|uniref:hypothetical protein n=1 Tax=Candidatus Hodgkinia cicadicola TaxID=573658 RepID=UPI0011BAB876
MIGCVNTETSTQHPMKWSNLLRVNKSNYIMNYSLSINNIRRIKHCNVIFDRLNSSILNLFMVVVGFETNGYRYHNVLNVLFFDVLQNVITLICSRNIKYSEVVDEVINRTR